MARKAEEGTRPNPRVGAVVVKGGKLQGAGFIEGLANLMRKSWHCERLE